MKTYKFLPYDKNLVSRARELRKSETEAEKKFWKEITKHPQLVKYKFTRQKPLGNFVVDFYCAKFKLAIEIDGELHKFQKIRDTERDNLLMQKFGVRVIRYSNTEVLTRPGGILKNLIKLINPS